MAEFTVDRGDTPATNPGAVERAEGADNQTIQHGQVIDGQSDFPEKFKAEDGTLDAAKLLESYRQLESQVGTPPDPSPTAPQEAQLTIQDSGPDARLQPFIEEFASNGRLSDDSYAALGNMGVGREIVDRYIELETGAAQRDAQAVIDSAGGAEAYRSMIEWAKTGLTPSEQEVFNKAVGDPAQREFAVNGLKARYEAANGTNPNLLTGNQEGGAAQPFETYEDFLAAQRDPQYKSNPEYRRNAIRRLKASHDAGIF